MNLLHVLFNIIDQTVPLCGRVRFAPIGVDFISWSICGVVSVGKANVHRQGRVAHEFRPTGHDGVAVMIRMRVVPEFFFSLSQQPGRLFWSAASFFVELKSYFGSLFVENIPIDTPTAQELQ